MNAVERVLVYTDLPPEGDTRTPNDPSVCWPENGEIKFIDAELAYREGLPLVLKGISFEVAPGEKVHSFSSSVLDICLTAESTGGYSRSHRCR